jgi:hypothetical protein
MLQGQGTISPPLTAQLRVCNYPLPALLRKQAGNSQSLDGRMHMQHMSLFEMQRNMFRLLKQQNATTNVL